MEFPTRLDSQRFLRIGTVRVLLLICFLVTGITGFSQNRPKLQGLEAINALTTGNTDSLYIINLWATWCIPCIEELPYFEQIREKYDTKRVRVVLVSLDRPADIGTRVAPFVDKMNLQSTVWILDEKDPNVFIPAIDSQWSGAIPATLFSQPSTGLYRFYEKPFTFTELEQIIEPIINQ